jgi:ribonuclease R
MKNFLLELSHGMKLSDVPAEFTQLVEKLQHEKALKLKMGQLSLDSKYRFGVLDVSRNGTGYLDSLGHEKSKDLTIDDFNLNNGYKGDLVLAKRLFSKKGAKAKVIMILKRAHAVSVAYTQEVQGEILVKNIKTELPMIVASSQKALKELPLGSVLKIDNYTSTIMDVLGVLDDPKVDEKISLGLFNKSEFFSPECEKEAKSFGDTVFKDEYPDRVDLTNLPFCTIDPPDAKDFDDAIYFDVETTTLYVAIADVSSYVIEDTCLDKEAKARGFSIYFPHKSIPMLPRSLSENICSLKPDEDRLAFTFKITLDPISLEPIKEEVMEAVIHSRRRFTYDEIDAFLEGDFSKKEDGDDLIWKYLEPLQKFLLKIKKRRLAHGCEFSSDEMRMTLDENQNLISIRKESETPSHALIEDAMLLANKAAAKQYEKGMFRTHGVPNPEKIEELLSSLENIGVFSQMYEDVYKTIRQLQTVADEKALRKEVDQLIIRTQKQAQYTAENEGGHFGLGFTTYTHFTSPIRRYSDLIVHRLIKAIMIGDKEKVAYIVGNADVIALRVSELERESAKCAWDYADRKYARWAKAHEGDVFEALVTDVSTAVPTAYIEGEIPGARVSLIGAEGLALFDKVKVEIKEAHITTTKIIATVQEVLRDDV